MSDGRTNAHAMDLVLRLREARRMSGMTQRVAAERARIGVKSLSMYETGRRIESLKVRQLERLLAAYEFTIAEFFSDEFVERAQR